MATPVVSVLIPVYNVEDYLEKCLDSVVSQTLNNIEIICVDDGSTDGSAEILKEYQKKDKRINIITKENGGLPSARNAGLEVARGKYIGFVDSDDFIEPNMYETMVNSAKQHDSDVVICGANIFPESPRAEQWLYDTLSPCARHYEKFDSDILFKAVDTTPFLWRTIVSKRLIDSQNFRLDENVILGEDKAFQCKVYPYAKGITVIPDKLYNYYWCRPGSLMAETAYTNITAKVEKHVKLVSSIAQYISGSELDPDDKRQTIKDYFDWAVPFVYQDFIYCSLDEKITFSKKITEYFEKMGVHQFVILWEEWKKQQLQYIRSFENVTRQGEVLLSVIIPAEYEDEYMEEAFEQIRSIHQENIEFIVVNNGMENSNYADLLKLMEKRPAVRLYNTPKHLSYAELLNRGISLANGKYISILEPKDWYYSEEKLKEWLKCAVKGDFDCCISKHLEKNDDTALVGETVYATNQSSGIWECDFHDVLYKTSFLKENELEFEEYATFTGLDFWSRVYFEAERIGFFDDYAYCIRKCWNQDWLRTEKCELILECLDKVLKLSIEKKNAFLHGKVFHLLNSDEVKHIIVNGTKMYHMSAEDCPNGENEQIKTVLMLYSILQNANTEMLKECGFDEKDSIMEVLYEVVRERQRFLANI